MELLELAERCEEASGPDRELEWVIAFALHPGLASVPKETWQEDTPRYTQSYDAAMQLVDDGQRRVEFGTHDRGSWAYVHAGNDTVGESDGASNEPLAISAAAIRALAA